MMSQIPVRDIIGMFHLNYTYEQSGLETSSSFSAFSFQLWWLYIIRTSPKYLLYNLQGVILGGSVLPTTLGYYAFSFMFKAL